MSLRERMVELGPKLAQLEGEDAIRTAAADLGQLEAGELVLRVREHLLVFAREHRVLVAMEGRLRRAAEDERLWLEKVFDGMRMTFADSLPFARDRNPDVSASELDVILSAVRELPPVVQIRAAWFLSRRFPTGVTISESDGGEARAMLKSFTVIGRRPHPDQGKALALYEQAEREQRFFDSLDSGRHEHSEAGEKLSEGEMQTLLRQLKEFTPNRCDLFADALCAMCLGSKFAPERTNKNATDTAQIALADFFWSRAT